MATRVAAWMVSMALTAKSTLTSALRHPARTPVLVRILATGTAACVPPGPLAVHAKPVSLAIRRHVFSTRLAHLIYGVLTAGFVCTCPASHTGANCESVLIDECASSPCQNSGTCILDEISFFFNCDCTAAFKGAFCEIPVDKVPILYFFFIPLLCFIFHVM